MARPVRNWWTRGLVWAAVGGVVLGVPIPSVAQGDPPPLTVVLVVDQMRPDYLTRFAYELTGGLARLQREGIVFDSAFHDHGITATAAGHATISTGVYPSRHGIVSNDWWNRRAHRPVYAVEDTTVEVIGATGDWAPSPSHLEREAIGDWLAAQRPAGKVYSIAVKDRSAVLMGGKRPDGAYWFDSELGGFATSTYYRDTMPAWIEAFNDSGPRDDFFAAGWQRLLPEEAYTASREDSFPAENDGIAVVFPHRFAPDSADETGGPGRTYYRDLPNTPFGDQLLFAFAQRLIEEEELGTDGEPDLLFVGASSADLVGHAFGPYSQEVQDYYLRLDGMLDDFLAFLDARVGNYRLVLTSDHGVAPVPEESARRGHDALRLGALEMQEIVVPPLSEVMAEFRAPVRPRIAIVYGLTIDYPDGTFDDERWTSFRRATARGIRRSYWVADAIAYDDILEPTDDPYRQLYQRSFYPGRVSDVIIRYPPLYVRRSEVGGTDHGTPYDYDRHVPLIIWQPGSEGARRAEPVRTVDIAPTIASWLGIAPPPDLDGTALSSVNRAQSVPGRRP